MDDLKTVIDVFCKIADVRARRLDIVTHGAMHSGNEGYPYALIEIKRPFSG